MSNRPLWFGLAVSLALNLFIGGAVIGALVQHARQPPPPPPPSEPAPVAVAPAPAPAPAPVPVATKNPAPAPTPEPVAVQPSPPPVMAPGLGGPPPGQPGQPGQPGGNPLLRAGDELPPQIRGPYRAALRDAAEASRPKLAEARRARNEVARLMGAPNFDPAAVTAALDRARASEADARSDVEGAMVKFASAMTLPQRRILAAGLREEQPQGRGGGQPGGRGPFGPQGRGGRGPGRGGPPGGPQGPQGEGPPG